MMSDARYNEIVSFQNAMGQNDFKLAKNIMLNAKHVSGKQLLTWEWQLLDRQTDLDLLNLSKIIIESDYPIGLLYIYFEKCLDRNDINLYDKIFRKINFSKYDDDSSVYFRVMRNYMLGNQSDKEDKKIARLLHTKKKSLFIVYLNE